MAFAKGVTTRFRILGPIEVLEGAERLPLGAPKQRAVLAALLLARNEVVPRDRLVDAVWGDEPPEAAPRSLQVYVHGLRRALGAERIETHGSGYRALVEPGELDLDQFDDLMRRARSSLAAGAPARAQADVRRALELWTGPPLADLAGEPVADAHIGPLAELRVDALELRGDVELALGRHEGLVSELEELVVGHPYRERLRAQLVLALYRSGRQKEALEAYRAAHRTLTAELGVEPGPELRELERAVLRHDPALAAPETSHAAVSLPAPPTPLVGRRLEVAAVAALVREGARLVTLTGPGGAGKTRLAIAVAEELAGEFDDGALFVDLAPVVEPELLGPTIAGALRISESGEPVEEAIAAHLEPRRLLLVLDNLEQLLPAAPQVGSLLARAPGLAVLATSRAPLRVRAEQEYLVPPLAVPPPTAGFEQLSGSDAVRLFAQRARAVDTSFQITDANAPSIAEICARLDGLPLAIELAAGRTKLLPPEALAARLGSALDLAARAPDRPARQQTLRATLDWSCRALAEDERDALARLGVFAGGFGLNGAEAVCGPAVLEPLTTLVEVNLVRRVESGADPRFAMLETIREYAGELLAASSEDASTRSRHAAYVLAVAEAAAADLAVGEGEPFERFAREHENVREALAWAASNGDVATEVRLAVAMSWYWAVRGHLAEGRHALEHAVEAASGDTRLTADALVRAGLFPYRQGDLDAARALWEEALRLNRELGDVDGITQCVAELGGVAVAEGDLESARAAYEEAALGFEQAGNRVRLGIANANLSAIANMQGDYQAAARFGFDAVALQEENGDEDGLAVTLQNLSRTILRLGDRERARETLERSLAIACSLAYQEVIAYCLEGAAEFAAADGDDNAAVRLLGASEAAFERLGVPMSGEEAETADAIRTVLGADTVAAALDAARRADPAQAVDEARAVLAARRDRERAAV